MLEKNIETKKMNAGGRATNEKRCEKAQKKKKETDLSKKDRSAKKDGMLDYSGLELSISAST